VDLILALTRNVTGIKLNAFFAPITEEGSQQAPPRQQGFLWQRADGFGHVLRRWIIRCAPRAAAPRRAACGHAQAGMDEIFRPARCPAFVTIEVGVVKQARLALALGSWSCTQACARHHLPAGSRRAL